MDLLYALIALAAVIWLAVLVFTETRLSIALRLWRDPKLSYSWRRAWRKAGYLFYSL
jgi:hypothetical protein